MLRCVNSIRCLRTFWQMLKSADLIVLGHQYGRCDVMWKHSINLPCYLPFLTYLLCYVVLFLIVGLWISFDHFICNIFGVFLLYFFCFFCWFTLRNFALGKVLFCLRNRTQRRKLLLHTDSFLCQALRGFIYN